MARMSGARVRNRMAAHPCPLVLPAHSASEPTAATEGNGTRPGNGAAEPSTSRAHDQIGPNYIELSRRDVAWARADLRSCPGEPAEPTTQPVPRGEGPWPPAARLARAAAERTLRGDAARRAGTAGRAQPARCRAH